MRATILRALDDAAIRSPRWPRRGALRRARRARLLGTDGAGAVGGGRGAGARGTSGLGRGHERFPGLLRQPLLRELLKYI
jgi:hypothetical protein